MKTVLLILLAGAIPAAAQLTQATGDDFTVAVYNDTHTQNSQSDWTNAVNWMLGLSGRGPGGQSALSYWNIKSISHVGDYASPGTADCTQSYWTFATTGFSQLFGANLPGIWVQGDHDLCAQYTTLVGSRPGITYGPSTTLQAQAFNVVTSVGLVKLGLVGAGVADDMAVPSASRTWVDGVLNSSESNRQWIFLRHVGTYAPINSPGPYNFPADGNSGWCIDTTTCAGYAGVNAGNALRDNFYLQEPKVFWGVHGHNGYVAVDNLTANDGHAIHVTGNLGATGGTPGWVTLMKFRPSHNDIQVAVYLSNQGTTGTLYQGPFTWAWTPTPDTSASLFPLPLPVSGGSAVIPPPNGTFTVSQVSFTDCFPLGCTGKVQDGDTTIFTSWANAANTTINGASVPGTLYGTTNDSNIYYSPTPGQGPNCSGGNIEWLKIPVIDTINNVTGSTGNIYSSNCMFSFGLTPGDTLWSPAARWTCSQGYINNCDWKSQGNICVDGVCYLSVQRQATKQDQPANPPGSRFFAYDSTIVKTSDAGASWLNPAHVGGTPSTTGDAPLGPGDATYPASMIWPDPPAHNGISQHMARLQFVQYGRDGVTYPNVDNNSKYIYSISYDGAFSKYYLGRWLRANAPNLSASDWSYYVCPGYTSAVCDGMSDANWSSTMSAGTPILPGIGVSLGGVMYVDELKTYVITGGNNGPVPPAIITAPHPWGPFTAIVPPGTVTTGVGFAAPILASVKVIVPASKVQFILGVTVYPATTGILPGPHSGSGTPGYLTYELTASSSSVPSGVTVAGVTNTQAVISYVAPTPSACTVDVSESPSFVPDVNDTSTSLFTGANLDSRVSTISGFDAGGNVCANCRSFIAGSRTVEISPVDSTNYSRALQANTTHYYKIACGGTPATGSFTTTNIPTNMTYQDGPTTLNPTLSTTNRSQVIIDPHTGAHVNRVSLPGDVSNPGPFMYSSGFSQVCGQNLIGPTPGYLCSFPSGSGSPGTAMYYIDPIGETSVYLGYNSWGASGPVINPIDGKFYVMDHATNLVAFTYNGNFLPHSYSPASFSGPVTVLANFKTAVQTFAPSFDPTAYACGDPTSNTGVTAIGDYITVLCHIGAQNSYAWEATVKISTGQVVAAVKTTDNLQSRWCATHQVVPLWDQPGMFINTHGLDGSDSGKGTGPYRTTYTGGNISSGVTSITVSGEPTCSGACIPNAQDPIAAVGDWYNWSDNSDPVQITGKSSSTAWTITATTKSHVTSATLTASCGQPGTGYPPIFWNYSQDSLGTDTTNTYYVNNQNWFLGGHDLYTTGIAATENNGWTFRIGNLLANIGGTNTNTVSSSPLFAGALANCFGDGCKRHPSAAFTTDWITDYQGWDGSYYNPNDNFLTPLAGTATMGTSQLWKYTSGAFKTDQKHFSIVGSTSTPVAGGPFPFLNTSGPSCSIGPLNADNFTFGIVNAPGECVAGSVKGEIYVNIRQTLCVDATGSTTAYTCPTPTNPPSAYSVVGIPFYIRFTPQTTNTTTGPTLNIAGIGVKDIKDSSGNMTIGGLVGGTTYQLAWFDNHSGTQQFRVTSTIGCGPNGPCIVSYNSGAGSVVQIMAAGNTYRAITQGLVQLRATNDYPTGKVLPDRSHILFTQGDADHTNLSQLLMAKLPPFAAFDAVNRTTFIRRSVTSTPPAGLGVTTAAVEFGYLENGLPSDHFCTQRKEACVAIAATVTDATPFQYATTDTYTRLGCTSTGPCTIQIPILPAHVAYYQMKFFNASGVLVATGISGVLGDY